MSKPSGSTGKTSSGVTGKATDGKPAVKPVIVPSNVMITKGSQEKGIQKASNGQIKGQGK